MSTKVNIAKSVAESDLVIGAVLIPGAAAPKLVTEDMIESMNDGGVVVDIAIDQGGLLRLPTVLLPMIIRLILSTASSIMPLPTSLVRYHVQRL